MKKQVLIAAVAATMTSVAMADISITGNAKFEYTNVETGSNAATNNTNTEVNMTVKGKTGDTTAVINLEANTSGSASAANALDIEDMYVTTKIGALNVKAGNFASSTSALLGEIDEGDRAINKISLTTDVGPATIGYHVDGGTTSTVAATQLNSDSAAVTLSMPVAGWKVQVKEQSDSYTGLGVAGSVAGVDVRLEQKNSDTANSDVTFGNISTEINGITLGYAFLDVDNTDALVTETDSAIFAVENGSAVDSDTARDNQQISLKTTVAGNTITLKSGSIDKGISTTVDQDYAQIDVKRSLASGATLAVTYTDKDASATTSTETFEVDLSVKF